MLADGSRRRGIRPPEGEAGRSGSRKAAEAPTPTPRKVASTARLPYPLTLSVEDPHS